MTAIAQSGSVNPPSLDSLPPGIRGALDHGENLIWASRGNGQRWLLEFSVLPIATIGFTAVLLWYFLNSLDGDAAAFQVPFGIMFGAILAWNAFVSSRMFFGPSFETYALTNRRVIVHTAFGPPATRSLAFSPARGDRSSPITRLTVFGTRDGRGWIMLRDDNPRRGALSLVGIDRPLAVAQLIKSTLNLPFEIEDHTR